MKKAFFEEGQFKTGENDDLTFRPVLTNFSEQDYDMLARRFAERTPYYVVYSCQPSADNWVKALNKYTKPDAEIAVAADIYTSSGMRLRKFCNRMAADMDRGKIKSGQVMGLAIFALTSSNCNFIHSIFKLDKAYHEN